MSPPAAKILLDENKIRGVIVTLLIFLSKGSDSNRTPSKVVAGCSWLV